MSILVDREEQYVEMDVVEEVFVRLPNQRLRVQCVPVGESMTLQSEASACDINEIIARFDRDGFLPAARMEGQYGDVSELHGDFGELVSRSIAALGELREAQAAFDARKSADLKKLADEKEAIYQAHLARLKEEQESKEKPA